MSFPSWQTLRAGTGSAWPPLGRCGVCVEGILPLHPPPIRCMARGRVPHECGIHPSRVNASNTLQSSWTGCISVQLPLKWRPQKQWQQCGSRIAWDSHASIRCGIIAEKCLHRPHPSSPRETDAVLRRWIFISHSDYLFNKRRRPGGNGGFI